MSRYIDADALEYDTEWSEYHDGFTAYSQMAIDTAPSIDIVRCGECRYWAGSDIGDIDDWEECRWREDEATDADDYCSYGERRE